MKPSDLIQILNLPFLAEYRILLCYREPFIGPSPWTEKFSIEIDPLRSVIRIVAEELS